MIRERVNVPSFKFHPTSFAEIESEIYNLNAKKSNRENSISALKEIEICGMYLYKIISHSLINHNLLIAKLHAYGFDKNALKLKKSYLTIRWQRTKVNNAYIDRTEILHGVPQGSILGPLLFNIYLNDLFFVTIDTSLCNFADDNTLYACDISLKILIDKLESSATLVIDWFNYNYMKLNDSKCNLLVCGYKEEVIIAKIGNALN